MVLKEARRDHQIPETGVRLVSCLSQCWGLSCGLEEEQPVLFTPEPSLSPPLNDLFVSVFLIFSETHASNLHNNLRIILIIESKDILILILRG